MKAIISGASGAELADVAIPQPKSSEILVRVKAASLNRADLGTLAAKDGRVIGMEWAGEVVEVGPEAGPYKVGDRVMCTGSGAYAEYAVTDGGRACKIPDSLLPYEEAAVLTLALQTMHDALVTTGRMRSGDAVMIHGASSGVGLMGLQIARLLGARQVIGSSSTAARRERLPEFGATHTVNPTQTGWVQTILDVTTGNGVDVIVDQISGAQFADTMKTAAVGARIINVGRLGGGSGEFDFQLHALRRISYVGVTFRTRSVQEIRALNARMLQDLAPAIADRRLRLPVDSSFPLAEATRALDRMQLNEHFGKIVLSI